MLNPVCIALFMQVVCCSSIPLFAHVHLNLVLNGLLLALGYFGVDLGQDVQMGANICRRMFTDARNNTCQVGAFPLEPTGSAASSSQQQEHHFRLVALSVRSISLEIWIGLAPVTKS